MGIVGFGGKSGRPPGADVLGISRCSMPIWMLSPEVKSRKRHTGSRRYACYQIPKRAGRGMFGRGGLPKSWNPQ